jgi:hypothetical protein
MAALWCGRIKHAPCTQREDPYNTPPDKAGCTTVPAGNAGSII